MIDVFIYDVVCMLCGKGCNDGSLYEVIFVVLFVCLLNVVKVCNGLEGYVVEDVIWGNVMQVKEQGGCFVCLVVLEFDFDQLIFGFVINCFCVSGMEVVNFVVN